MRSPAEIVAALLGNLLVTAFRYSRTTLKLIRRDGPVLIVKVGQKRYRITVEEI
jgi:hypothetical protein